jgi:hypothetical protein
VLVGVVWLLAGIPRILFEGVGPHLRERSGGPLPGEHEQDGWDWLVFATFAASAYNSTTYSTYVPICPMALSLLMSICVSYLSLSLCRRNRLVNNVNYSGMCGLLAARLEGAYIVYGAALHR